jgi:hypothetical protein
MPTSKPGSRPNLPQESCPMLVLRARSPYRVEARPRQGADGGHQLGAENTECDPEWTEASFAGRSPRRTTKPKAQSIRTRNGRSQRQHAPPSSVHTLLGLLRPLWFSGVRSRYTTFCVAVITLLGSLACNVASPDNTGGTNITAGACGRGLVVVNTDYQSTNVSLVSIDGEVLSASFLSSASTPAGLSAPLGGDVVVPTHRAEGDAVVLLDRYPASVLTWVDIRSGSPSGQLSVATGFAANPRDYLQLSPSKAYVTRYDPNLDPGRETFDEGSDIVVVDPAARTLEGRIPLYLAMQDAPAGYFPRPDRLLPVGSDVAVLLGGYSQDFVSSVPSRVARLDPALDRVDSSLVLEGMHGCTAMALSPSGQEVAVSCSGEFAGDSVATLAESGIVLMSVRDEWVERRRFPAAKFGTGPVGGGIAYANDARLLFTTLGEYDEAGAVRREDALVVVDTDTGDFEVVLRSAGKPFTLGDVRCAPACGVCFVADAQRSGGVVHRYEVDAGGNLGQPREIVVDRAIGLPPRNLGWF